VLHNIFQLDYLDKIKKIIAFLEQNDAQDYANKISEVQLSACTGGELLSSVTHTLLQIVKQDERIKKLIGKDVWELKSYCHSIGLIVK